jgi:acyl-CoA thioesterase
MEKEHIESIKKMFIRDRYIVANGVRIGTINEDFAEVSAEITDNHLNAADSVQGGFIYTLADFAFAVFANANFGMTVTQSSSFSFIAAAVNVKTLTAHATLAARAKKSTVVNVSVSDESGNVVAVGIFNGFSSGAPFADVGSKKY